MAKSQGARKCEYTHCLAAESINKRAYLIRGTVFFSGWVALITNADSFNFTNLILLLIPAFIDNYSEIIRIFEIKPLLWIDRAVKLANIIIIFICISGIMGFVVDKNISFEVIGTAIIGAGICVKKSWIAIILLLDFIETLIMAFFVPNRFDSTIINSNKKVKKA